MRFYLNKVIIIIIIIIHFSRKNDQKLMIFGMYKYQNER
jgi:hypothetical protein